MSTISAGYKQTEVGPIPENWQVVPMAALGNFSKGQGIRKDEAASGDIPCIRYGEIYTHHDDIIRSYNSRISREVAATSKRLRQGDLLFAGSGETKEEIGKCVAFIADDEAYAGGDIVVLSPHSADSEFLGYLLNAPFIVRQKASKGQGDAVVHISATALGSVRVPIPADEYEQRAIASALSDVDALLAKLDQIIAKKRDLKQAAMQQLLTGQTRLPGFSGAWSTIRMSKHASLKARIGWQALTTAEYMDEGDYFLVTGTDFIGGRVNWSSCHYVDQWRYDQDRNIQLRDGDVLLTKDGTIGKVGYVDGLQGPATLNSGVFVIRPLQEFFFPLFLFYILKSKVFDEFLAMITAGSTIVHLYQKDFVTFEFLAPSIEEQTAIATVLSDMDAELAALEARRDKTRALKQGMMQELLTGRIRLVKPEKADV